MRNNNKNEDFECTTGTNTYMSPERQLEIDNINHEKDDIWAVGVLILEILLWKHIKKYGYILSKKEIKDPNCLWLDIIKEDIKKYDKENIIFEDKLLLDLLNNIFSPDQELLKYLLKKAITENLLIIIDIVFL